jgi:hypothetical protein
VPKFSAYRFHGFKDFEILAYRRIQRDGIPFFACLEQSVPFADSLALIFSTCGSSNFNNLSNFPLLVGTLEFLHKVNRINGDIRMENIVFDGKYFVLSIWPFRVIIRRILLFLFLRAISGLQ